MVIESDSHVRDLMRAKLAASGISVTAERPHGIAAQQAIQEMQPQLIFVAIEQPIQRAMQVVDFARAQVPGAMIVAYSGSWSPTVERRLMQSGVNDFLHGKISREQMNNIANGPAQGRRMRLSDAEATRHRRRRPEGRDQRRRHEPGCGHRRENNTVLLIDTTRFGDVAVMMDVKPTTVSEWRATTYLDRDAFRSILLRHESAPSSCPRRATTGAG
jgi:CheY-like chemotaxis protein